MNNDYHSLFIWLSVISFATFVISLLSLPWLVSLIPEDYFLHKERLPTAKQEHPVARLIFLIAKNLLGGILLVGGVLMLFLPGQGLLTIAIAMILLDYPGKYHLERHIASKPLILNGLNWLRKKAHKAPIKSPVEIDT